MCIRKDNIRERLKIQERGMISQIERVDEIKMTGGGNKYGTGENQYLWIHL